MSRVQRIPVSKYMSPAVHTTEPQEKLTVAYQRMLDLDIRHLPVLSDGKLVGLLFKSDLKLLDVVESPDIAALVVESVMITECYSVAPDTPIDVVAETMAKKKYGSAVLMEGGTVVGMFTNTDALGVLMDALTDSLWESVPSG